MVGVGFVWGGCCLEEDGGRMVDKRFAIWWGVMARDFLVGGERRGEGLRWIGWRIEVEVEVRSGSLRGVCGRCGGWMDGGGVFGREGEGMGLEEVGLVMCDYCGGKRKRIRNVHTSY